MERFDSTALFSIFKNEEGENLLPFDEMAALLDLGELADVPLINTATNQLQPPVVTTEGPASTLYADAQVLLPAMVPSASGAGDSEHTRAQGWASQPSSEGAGDSDGSDMDDPLQVPAHTEGGGQPSSGPTAATSGEPPRGRGGRSTRATSGVKKRRQRNAEQMESNRVAQQKYRQRKKHEQSALQQAVDLLTAQVAALKAVEVRAGALEAENSVLRSAVKEQGASIAALQQHNMEQAAQLDAARNALMHSQAQVAAHGKVILDQQAKLRLQEQVIASLKDRLKEKIDEALQHVTPGTVCEKMVAAVKATLYGAKDVHGLQEILAQLPEHLVNEICRNIFHVCKESWSDLRARCSQQAGGQSCMTGTA